MEVERLRTVRLFSGLSKSELQAVARGAQEVDVPAGFKLVYEGHTAYEFFVIEQGTASVVRGEEEIAELGPGEFFGEIAMLETDRRTASVVAKTPMLLIVLHQRDFERIADELPTVADRIRSAVRARREA